MIGPNISQLLSNAASLKPKDLIMNDLKWKYLLWAIYRRKNILFVGHTRCGKTRSAKAAAEVFSTLKEAILSEEELKILKSSLNIKIEKIEEI